MSGRLEPNGGWVRQTPVMRPLANMWSPLRLLSVVAVCALVLAAAWLWFDRDGDGAEVVGDSSHRGWMTIRYRGVQVDIPASWERLDKSECEFQFEVWAPPNLKGCEWASGVAFYASATFDSAHEPGVSRTKIRNEPEWGGYTYVGTFAIYASDDDRQTVM